MVGMDNTFLAEIVSPQLSSVDFSKEDFARCLVDTMLKLIQKEPVEDVFLETSLVVRESA